MKEFQSLGWYAARVAPYLPKKAFKPSPSRLWGGLIYTLVVIAGFLLIGLLNLNIWLNLGIAIVLGLSFAGMGFLGHEILHGTVVRTAWLRDLLGAIAFWPLSTGPKLWRKWHNVKHHAHTQVEELDPDAWPSITALSNNKLMRWMYRLPFFIRSFFGYVGLALTFTFHSSNMFLTYIKDFNPKKRPIVLIQLLLPWISWFGLLFVLGFQKWIFAYVLPLLIANFIVMAYIATNHRLNPLVPVNDPLANSLTVTVPRWVDVLHFNFSYHTEHHLFPSMSPKYYPLVKQRLKEMWPERYHEMPLLKALKVLGKTPRLYYEDKEFIEPRQQNTYGSLGYGLNPDVIESRPLNKKTTKVR